MRALTGAATKMNAENFVAVGFVFWLLLDLIQGAYDLARRVGRRAAAGADRDRRCRRPRCGWASPAGRGACRAAWSNWPPRPWTARRSGGWCRSASSLGMLNFAYAVGFDIPRCSPTSASSAGRAVGTRPARRVGLVHRPDAVLRLRVAEPDGGPDHAAGLQVSDLDGDRHVGHHAGVSGAGRRPPHHRRDLSAPPSSSGCSRSVAEPAQDRRPPAPR